MDKLGIHVFSNKISLDNIIFELIIGTQQLPKHPKTWKPIAFITSNKISETIQKIQKVKQNNKIQEKRIGRIEVSFHKKSQEEKINMIISSSPFQRKGDKMINESKVNLRELEKHGIEIHLRKILLKEIMQEYKPFISKLFLIHSHLINPSLKKRLLKIYGVEGDVNSIIQIPLEKAHEKIKKYLEKHPLNQGKNKIKIHYH